MNIKIKEWIFTILAFILFYHPHNIFAQTTTYEMTSESEVNTYHKDTKFINPKNFAFPNGKLKCLVISFDDGPEHDRILIEKLNKAGIVGTFHLNSGRLGKNAEWLSTELNYDVHFVKESEVSSLYKGHEVSGHTAHHAGLNAQKDSIIRAELVSDFAKLNANIDSNDFYPVQGLAYPFGAYDENTLRVLEEINVKYARTTAATSHFELPSTHFLTFDPTCHIFDALNYGSYFVNNTSSEMQLLNIWGHSYEFHNNWELADSICHILGNKDEIWYAQSIELVDYLKAIENLSYSENSVFNPSENMAVWIKNPKGKFVELHPGESMKVDFQSSFKEIKETDLLYPAKSTIIKYHGDWTKNHYKERIASFKETPLKHNEIVFVGNSITEQGEDWSDKLGLENVRNRGIAGDVTDGLFKRINEITYYQPSSVFLLIGINDLFNMHYQKQIPSSEYVAENILKITQKIHKDSPETQIYLQTILPTSEEYMVGYINEVNSILRNNANGETYILIDLFQEFVGEDELIKPKLTSDGTHLNNLGYDLWVQTIKSKTKIFNN